MAGRISVTLHEDVHAAFRVKGLSDEEFRAYLGAMEGVPYARKLQARVATLDRVGAILVRLRKAGLGVRASDMEPDLRRSLQERSRAQDWLDRDGLRDRIARIEKDLHARGERLFDHQRLGIAWLAKKHGAVLADDQGTGKTAQALISMPASACGIVVCPSGVKGVWLAAVHRWRPQLSVEILKGRKSFRWPRPGEILITNYDILPNVHDQQGVTGKEPCTGFLPARVCPGCEDKITFVAGGSAVTKTRTAHRDGCTGKLQEDLDDPKPCPGCHPMLALAPRGMVWILDEAQQVKNAATNRHKRAVAISDVVRRKDGYVWPMTGTPLENEPSELWSILRIGTVHDEAFGSYDRFKSIFRARERFGAVSGWGMPSDEIRECLKRVMLRRLKGDILDLPAKTRKQNEVDLDQVALGNIDAALRASGRSVKEILDLIARDEVGFEFLSSVRAALAAAKVPRMLEIVEYHEDHGLPLVVFSDHRFPIERLASREGWVAIMGGDGAERVTAARDAFQNGYVAAEGEPYVLDKAGVRRRADVRGRVVYPKGIGITIKAGGTGHTLTRAGIVLFVDRAWNAQGNIQAEDRCHRIGSREAGHVAIDIIDIVSNHPLDARVSEVILQKIRLFEASINAAADRNVTSAELARELTEEHEAIAAGRAVRRPPGNPREREAWEALRALVFDRPEDENLSADLAEQADTIGLSEKQWALAIVITRRGRRPEDPPPLPKEEPEPERVEVPAAASATAGAGAGAELTSAPAPAPLSPRRKTAAPAPPQPRSTGAPAPAATGKIAVRVEPRPSPRRESVLDRRRQAWSDRRR